MTLAALHREVTRAILVAEGLPLGSAERCTAFREVAMLEEAIAGLTRPGDLYGIVARLGAVSARLSADEPIIASDLSERYLAEKLSGDVREKMLTLHAEAERAMCAIAQVTVSPVRFHLHT